ncbi:hypothetical protein CAEBREN_20717 [Caenorhabditis brenneri]|uniref:HAT C-terminal dimerisation domain-containing protein n=1 Tax=Caenorhabditis brenneri TaxID=135651 RepID=G0PK43_CAEBE|nr:hypothetical protein CAEBREN_20717 [Caenorhabditis brenneri]
MLRNDVPIITGDTARNDVMALEEEYRNRIKQDFAGRKNLVLISDGWSSLKSNFTLYSIMIGYLDPNYNMRQQLVGMVDVDKASAVNLHRLFCEELFKSDINISQFKYAVTDGGTNLKTLCEKLNLERSYCGCHLLHLIMEKVIEVGEVKRMLSKCKSVATKVSKSSKTRTLLKTKAQEFNINAPLPQNYSKTRWNGSRLLVKSVKEYIPVLVSLPSFAEDLFTLKERLLMEFFIEFTRPFQKATTRFESTNSSTSELLPYLSLLKRNVSEIYSIFLERADVLEHADTEVFQRIMSLADELLEKRLKKMREQQLLKMCSYLDPRFCKKQCLSPDEWGLVERDIISHFPEIELYNTILKQEPFKQLEDNVMLFWKSKRQNLPLLTELASELLTIPASSASTERVFSGAGRLMSNRLRNRLSSESCSSLLLVKAMIGYENFQTISEEDYGVLDSDDDRSTCNGLENRTDAPMIGAGDYSPLLDWSNHQIAIRDDGSDMDFDKYDDPNVPGPSERRINLRERATRIPRIQKKNLKSSKSK